MSASAKPVVSVIIPCYNSGQFLPEALESIQLPAGQYPHEVIIVDDGSTDALTLRLLQELSSRYTVIRQENRGPAAARNTGIRHAQGEYILFLDSDNKLKSTYIEKGIAVLKAKPAVGVVYCDPLFFGDTEEKRFYTQDFDLFKILESNFIDMCSLIRKAVWEEVGGLDESRVLLGHEDWEFWIRISATSWQFYRLDEALFEYRVRADSLVTQAVQATKHRAMLRYLYAKHIDLILQRYKYLDQQYTYYQYDQRNPLRTFIKFIYRKLTGKKQETRNLDKLFLQINEPGPEGITPEVL